MRLNVLPLNILTPALWRCVQLRVMIQYLLMESSSKPQGGNIIELRAVNSLCVSHDHSLCLPSLSQLISQPRARHHHMDISITVCPLNSHSPSLPGTPLHHSPHSRAHDDHLLRSGWYLWFLHVNFLWGMHIISNFSCKINISVYFWLCRMI